MSLPASVLVVGASAGGLSTAEALRRKGYQGTLTVLGAERHLPYDRPPLSKQVLSGAWESERTRLRPQETLESLNAQLLLNDAAVSLDAAARTVRTASGRKLAADAIVIATGIRPRALPGTGHLTGVHLLRTLEDAEALRADLLAAERLVVVGDGVLGAEIAATARGTGAEVTMVGPLATPMAVQLGPRVGGLLGEVHGEHGVRVLTGSSVNGLVENRGRVTGVRLDTGELLPADVVVVAIGSIPATAWLDGSGLALDNGVVCDSHCRAQEGIYAVGDVARWYHEGLSALVRLENRTNAAEQANAVAANILGADRPYTPVPYFWTDQYNVKVQVHGTLPAGAEMEIVEGSEADRRFVALYRSGGHVAGVLGWNMPKQARVHRQALVELGARPPSVSAPTTK